MVDVIGLSIGDQTPVIFLTSTVGSQKEFTVFSLHLRADDPSGSSVFLWSNV
jgi:hypothetical protein